MKIQIRMRQIAVLLLLASFALLLSWSSTRSAAATPDILGTFRTTYTTTTSDDVTCQLCHANSSGGNGWNGYGWAIHQGIDDGMSIADAILAIEMDDSDGNGMSNIDEINANTQPGWTDGDANTIFFSNGMTSTQAAPIAAELDPMVTITMTPGLSNPIPAPIMTGTHTIALTQIADGLVSPLVGKSTPSLPNYLYVVDQPGQVYQIDLTTGAKMVFIDTTADMPTLGAFGDFDERGLLGFAFHPDYANNGLVYTYVSELLSGTADFSTMPISPTANHQSVIAEWQVGDPADPSTTVDPTSKRELLRIDQPQFNHNGGDIVFGPDGMLYIAVGDGGGADDVDGQPFLEEGLIYGHNIGNGQNASNPLGTILRVDPMGDNAANGNYGIPADNPFVGDATMLDEIYAYGFRNVYRFSFDSMTGDMYAGDVGQNDIEELDLVVSGGNYGWNFKEGSFFFDPNGNQDGFVTDVDPGGLPADLIDPIAEYDHDEGISIISGYVYRGSEYPDLVGTYLFGDWSTDFVTPLGRLFYLDSSNEIMEFNIEGMDALGLFLHGFGQDANGELYVLGNGTGTPAPDGNDMNTGVVLRIDPIGQATAIQTSWQQADHTNSLVLILVSMTVLGGAMWFVRPN